MSRPISEDERQLVAHISMWGSEGYPVRKAGNHWTWGPFLSIRGVPTAYRTKREAVASFEAYHQVLIDALGAEAQARYFAEHPEAING